MKQSTLLLVLLLCTLNVSTAQKSHFKIPDSLSTWSFRYLDDKIYACKEDSSKAAVYLYTYLYKAKEEQNWQEAMYGYQNILHFSPQNLRLTYADSMVYAAKKTRNEENIGSAYLSKGIVFYHQKKYEAAFDNYIVANNYISRTNDQYLINKVKYQIAQIKYYLGFYDEAISLFTQCLDFFKKDDERAYLNTLHSLGLSYNRTGNYGLCSEFNTKGIAESKRLETSDMLFYFVHSEGINHYFKHNFDLAITQIESVIDSIKEINDFANESVGYFYIGKSYWALNKREKAIPYFLKVDKIFRDKNYLRPDQREVYEFLITYYKSQNNLPLQLTYIDQLLKADTVLKETYTYLVTKIHKEYDTKELLVEKEKIKKQLFWERQFDYILTSIILLLLLISLYLTYRHFKNQRFYKKKFAALMSQTPSENASHSLIKTREASSLDIPADTVQHVLNELEKFERDKKFLGKDMRLGTLAAAFNSNQKYLSKIIIQYKGKGIVEYTNDLKIDYILNLLKQNKLARNYTNAALAEEVGFTSTQRFVHAFKARTEMPTAEFIKLLKKE